MVHPRDRHLESQNRASANIHSIASTDTKIASTNLTDFIEPLTTHGKTNTNKVTLDKLHQSHIQKFKDDKEHLHKTCSKKEKYSKEHAELKKKSFQSLTETQLKRLFFLENEIQKLEDKIQKLKNNDDMTNYFMDTGNILYEYYDNLKSISKGDDDRRKRSLDSYQTSSDSNDFQNQAALV